MSKSKDKRDAVNCDRKYRHTTKESAIRHIDSLVHTTGARKQSLQYYRCKICDGWHVGHIKTTYLRSKRRGK